MTSANYSSIYLSAAALFGGLILLMAGGDILVSGAVRLARRWRMSPTLIGLTIVAFGTSTPELFVSLGASLQGYPDIMIGNVLGSNIANIGLILGISTLLAPIRATLKELSLELVLVIIASSTLVIIAFLGTFHRVIGILFVLVLICYTIRSYMQAAKNSNRKNNGHDESAEPLFTPLAFTFMGLAGLFWGSDLFIDGAVDIARHFRISELVIGLTLAAIGTSLPELASSLAAVRRQQGDMLLGNIIGSNLFNILMVFGCTAAITPFPFSLQMMRRDLPVMLLFTLALTGFIVNREKIGRLNGALFLSVYLIYIATLF